MDTILNINKIVVTRHAVTRFQQRFRLYFSHIKLSSKMMWDNVIANQVSKGRICIKWLQCPFYVNQHEGNYGYKPIIIYNKPCYYICKMDHGKLIVATVVHKCKNERELI